MSYGERYIMSFTSERGNDYRIVIYQQGYSGLAEEKKLGVPPTLAIEDGSGRIKGSSLSFSIQSDVEGELRGLYTTNNKEFRVLLYRNGILYWQGYLLPELYSENYVCPPYDVAVTATDQLATLKGITYNGGDVQTSLLDIIKDILSKTEISLQVALHMQLSLPGGVSVLRGAYISAAAFNGQDCYDALDSLLMSCNCSIMQVGNQWLVTSATDATQVYDVDGEYIERRHYTIGQMYQADVWPNGSLSMANAPALKGATVGYSYLLRNSYLKNADIVNRDGWMYTPDPRDDGRFPGVVDAEDGKRYNCFFWQLFQKNIQNDSSLQLWQDVRLNEDAAQTYSISFKYLITGIAKLLLLSVTYYGDNGKIYRLAGDGWVEDFNNDNIASYIQVTGESARGTYIWDVANISEYETAQVQFTLPATAGSIRIGFINSTSEYQDPTIKPSAVYVTQVYFTLAGISGQTATTEVEKMATGVQEEVQLIYGDPLRSTNGDPLVFNALKDAAGTEISGWLLSGREYSSYYLAMLQDYSRFYGTKKMQLQGSVMGVDALKAYYVDMFSGKVMQLLSGQYDLYADQANVLLEEVVDGFVDYEVVIYATDNRHPNSSGEHGPSVSVGGAGESYLGLQDDGDVYVKNERPLVGREARFEQQALPQAAPVDPKESEVYLYADSATAEVMPELGAKNINIYSLLKKLIELDKLWKIDPDNEDTIRTTYNVIIEKAITFGKGKKSEEGEGSGSQVGITTFDVYVGTDGPYTLKDGKVNLPAYPTVPKTLPNPYALSVNGVRYDGSAPVEIEIKAGVDDTQLADYARKEWVQQQGYIKEIPSEYITESELNDKGYVSVNTLKELIEAFDAYKVATDKRLARLEQMWHWDAANSAVRTEFNLIADGSFTFGNESAVVKEFIPFNVLDEDTGEYVPFKVLDESTGEYIPFNVKNPDYELLDIKIGDSSYGND